MLPRNAKGLRSPLASPAEMAIARAFTVTVGIFGFTRSCAVPELPLGRPPKLIVIV